METEEKLITPLQTSFFKLREDLEVPIFEGSRIGSRRIGTLSLLGVYHIYTRYKKFSVTSSPRNRLEMGKPYKTLLERLPEKQLEAWARIHTWMKSGLLDRVDYVNFLSIMMCDIDFTFLDVPYRPEELLAVLEKFESKIAFSRSDEFVRMSMDDPNYKISPEAKRYKNSSTGIICSDPTYQSFALNFLDAEHINLAYYRKLAIENYGKWDISKAHPRDKHYHKMLGLVHDERMQVFSRK